MLVALSQKYSWSWLYFFIQYAVANWPYGNLCLCCITWDLLMQVWSFSSWELVNGGRGKDIPYLQVTISLSIFTSRLVSWHTHKGPILGLLLFLDLEMSVFFPFSHILDRVSSASSFHWKILRGMKPWIKMANEIQHFFPVPKLTEPPASYFHGFSCKYLS